MSYAYQCDVCKCCYPNSAAIVAVEIKPWNIFHVCPECFKEPFETILKGGCPQEFNRYETAKKKKEPSK